MFFIDVFCPLRDLEVMDGVLAGSIFFFYRSSGRLDDGGSCLGLESGIVSLSASQVHAGSQSTRWVFFLNL